MRTPAQDREFGMERGKVFPADKARSLVNPLRRLVQSPGRTVASMGLADDSVVLEVGCGPGFFSPFIASAVPRGQVVLIDLQAEMLLHARLRLSEAANVFYAQGDACALPFRSAHFDAVLLATMLGEVPDRDLCITEVRRVVRLGGLVTVAETRRDSDFLALTSLRELLEPRGFTFVRRRGPAWQYSALFRATD